MTMKTKNVPKLRFKEFSGEWINKPFSAVASIRKGKFDPTKNKLSMKCIELEHLSQNTGEILGFIRSESVQSIKNIFKKGDVLFGKLRPNLRKYALAPFDGICSSEIWGLYSDIVPNDFLFQIVQSDRFYEQSTISTGTKMPRADWKVIAVCDFYFPLEIKEQQKIADFLYSVDKKIQHLKQKKQLLEQYKKGMMQKLFSQQIRFKDENGMDYADWETVFLGDESKISTGKLDANAMQANGKYRFYTCAKDFYFIDEYAFDTEALLISGNGANVGYIHYYKGKFNAYQRTYVLDKFSNKLYVHYLNYYLQEFLSKRIYSEKKEGNTPYIVLSTLSQMEIKLPIKQEQQKIADFLTSIDKKIDLTNSQITQTEQFKKGLLQQLFV